MTEKVFRSILDIMWMAFSRAMDDGSARDLMMQDRIERTLAAIFGLHPGMAVEPEAPEDGYGMTLLDRLDTFLVDEFHAHPSERDHFPEDRYSRLLFLFAQAGACLPWKTGWPVGSVVGNAYWDEGKFGPAGNRTPDELRAQGFSMYAMHNCPAFISIWAQSGREAWEIWDRIKDRSPISPCIEFMDGSGNKE